MNKPPQYAVVLSNPVSGIPFKSGDVIMSRASYMGWVIVGGGTGLNGLTWWTDQLVLKYINRSDFTALERVIYGL